MKSNSMLQYRRTFLAENVTSARLGVGERSALAGAVEGPCSPL